MAKDKKPHILIVEARFYDDLADMLVEGATDVLDAAGATYDRVAVPGSFEIPAAIRFAEKGKAKKYDGYIALGCVIRGETSHYDYVCGECARGVQDLTFKKDLAIGFGVLTVESGEQAYVRADKNKKNYGGGAAKACLRMIELQHHFGLDS